MPDRRRHRGPHPEDVELFAVGRLGALRTAVEEFAYLLTRGYADTAALQLVGNHHKLTQRQRTAVQRSCCSDEALARRGTTRERLSKCRGGSVGIDGYNLLITVESALSGGVILVGRDGCYRDLASVHGTYRKVTETLPALRLIASVLEGLGVRRADWFLDRPVSNSGRLRQLMIETLAGGPVAWNVEIVESPDRRLVEYAGPVASTDSWILDRCGRWVDLPGRVIGMEVPGAWIVDLRP